MNKSIGTIAITERGQVVMLTSLGETEERHNNFSLFDVGLILRGSHEGAVCSICRIKDTEGLRIVGHVGELVRLLEESGADLATPAEKPLSSLTPAERIERLERENSELKAHSAK